MEYEEHIGNLIKTAGGRLYVKTLADNFKDKGDIKSLEYLKVCVMSNSSSEESCKLSSMIQSMIDDIAV